jgi:polysaccharide biosynthesis/export protein
MRFPVPHAIKCMRSCTLIEIHMSHNCVCRWSIRLLSGLLVTLSAMAALAAPAVSDPYLIQPGDVLQVSVWKEPDLQSELLVRPDGGISFPLAGDVTVSGMSVAAVSDLIAERIKRYIPDPVVTVVTKLIGGNHIYVVGKVNRPGEFPFSRPLDVMQALSLAGGTTPFASLSSIRILRRDNGKQTALRFDYGDIEDGKALEKNILLRSGDTVVVP